MLRTEHQFTLPLGYVDAEGNLHREGTMRLSTAADEILPLKDPRVQANPPYLIIILLSRVVTQLGSIKAINPKVIEQLFVTDLNFLQDLYNRLNGIEKIDQEVLCPHCEKKIKIAPERLGEPAATP